VKDVVKLFVLRWIKIMKTSVLSRMLRLIHVRRIARGWL